MDRRRFISSATSLIAANSLLPVVGPGHSAWANSLSDLYSKVEELKGHTLTRIAFGSCNRQYASQRYWDVISDDRPDLWLWLGDNIYADFLSIEERANEYIRLKTNPYYQAFRLKTPIIGTWDDHDFASDNKGGEFPDKDASQDLFMDFMGLPLTHPMRMQRGVYSSEVFGPIGRQVHIIMLDLRYFRGDIKANVGLLGEIQWDWLEAQIKASTADLIIIGSSLHVSSNVNGFGLEGWNQFPSDRQRFYAMLDEITVPTLLLSGDRHMAEFTRSRLPSGKEIYEFMSSGMTHSAKVPLPDKNRIGKIIGSKNYGLINIDWSTGRPDLLLEIKSIDRKETYARLQPNFVNSRNQIFSSSW